MTEVATAAQSDDDDVKMFLKHKQHSERAYNESARLLLDKYRRMDNLLRVTSKPADNRDTEIDTSSI
jgi:hypothetical protein